MSYNIFLAGGVVIGIIVLVCGLPLCCYDAYMKSQEQKRLDEEYEKEFNRRKMSPSERYSIGLQEQDQTSELPEKILDFKTAMKDININV